MLEDKHIQIMQDYGLSFLQAKTYLILLTLGEADTKTIAKESNVARQEIYRVMPSLQKLGLGKKTIGKPIMYKATPLDEALSILLNKEKEEVAELEKKRSWLLKNIHQGTPKKSIDEDETQFTVISELTLFINSQKKLLAKTQESIDMIVPMVPCPPRFRELWLQLEETLKTRNNLKVRLITQGNIEALSRTIMNYPGFEWRIASERIYFGMNLFDKKELTVAIDEKTGLPSLWSNNPNIVTIARNYYALMWEKTSKTVPKKNQPALRVQGKIFGAFKLWFSVGLWGVLLNIGAVWFRCTNKVSRCQSRKKENPTQCAQSAGVLQAGANISLKK